MFNIKSIDEIFDGVSNLNIKEMKLGKKRSIRYKIQVRKKMMTINDLFDSIERRYNKFKYAYYNKGVPNLDKDRVAFCHRTTSLMLKKLKTVYKQMVKDKDPRAKAFGKRLENAEKIVQTYGNYIDRLNKGQCAKVSSNQIKSDSKKISK